MVLENRISSFAFIFVKVKTHSNIFGVKLSYIVPFLVPLFGYITTVVLYSIHYFVKIIYIVSQARKLQEEVGLTVNHLLRYDHFGTHNNEFFVLPCFFVNNIFENLM
jgi:hypothetical protein